jgi:hypothetical protein
MKNKIFMLFSALCFVTAIVHLFGFFGLMEGNKFRHLFFVFLNILGVYLMQKSPPFLFYLFPVLLIQQYYSHGLHFYKCYVEKGEIRGLDVVVLIVLPIAYYFIWVDFKNKKNTVNH